MRIYLDHAATTPVDEKVVEAMLPFFHEKYGNPSSLHAWGREALTAKENARQIIARKLNAEPSEIIFTSGGTEADNLALQGVASAIRKKDLRDQTKNQITKNQIITSAIEHPAVLNTCSYLESQGFQIIVLPVNEDGFVALDKLQAAINRSTCLVSIMHANNEIGTIQPLDKIMAICRGEEKRIKQRILVHSDAVQSFTKLTIDVKALDIDLLSISSHKIYGPKGMGALFCKKGTPLEPLLYGGHQEKNKRVGTENIPAIIGFGKATALATEEDNKKVESLRNLLITRIVQAIPDAHLNGPRWSPQESGEKQSDNRLCNNVNISFPGVDGEALLFALDRKGIAVSTGSACSSQSLEPSHVLRAIHLPQKYLHSSLRFTLGKENTKEEIETTVKVLVEIIHQLKKISRR